LSTVSIHYQTTLNTLLSQLTIKLHALVCLKLETKPYTCGEFSEGGWRQAGWLPRLWAF